METKKKSYKKITYAYFIPIEMVNHKKNAHFFFKIMFDLIVLIITSLIWQNHITILSFTILLFV